MTGTHKAILKAFHVHGAMTDYELVAIDFEGQVPQSIRRRRRELAAWGFLTQKGVGCSPTDKPVARFGRVRGKGIR